MGRSTLAYGFFGCVLVISMASGYGLYAVNRDRAIEQFQDRQLHTALGVANTLRSELAGLARTLRTIADGMEYESTTQLTRTFEKQFGCAEPPCFAAAAVYDVKGSVQYSSPRSVDLSDEDVVASLEWARDPDHRAAVRTAVSTCDTPSLVLLTPTHGAHGARRVPSGAMLAAQVSLDSIFGRQRNVDDKWPRYTTLVLDSDANVIFHSRHPEMRLNNVRKRTDECFECHETFWYIDHMLEKKTGIVQYSLHGVPHLGAFTAVDVEGRQWIAAVMGPAESALTVVRAEGRELGFLMLATMLALGAAVHMTWKDGRRRLEAEAAAAQRVHLERSHAALTALNTRLESAAVEWRTTVDTIDAPLLVLDPFGTIERMNRAASDLLPGRPFAWLGRSSERLAEHSPWDSALALSREAIARDSILTSRIHHHATGRTWDLWCRRSQRVGRRGSVVVVARDVTAVIDLQESLRRSETMAALGSLVAGVAHEVRNPLFAISSLVDAWSVQKKGDPQRFHQALRGEVGRLKSLMTELLEYGTPAKWTPVAYPLGAIVHEAVRSCAHEAEARGVRIVTPRALDIEVFVDPQRFVRVLINLVQNAVQHAPAASAVTVSTLFGADVDAPTAHVAVRDCGPGFRDDDLPRVFTPFFSRRAGGFGLGLAISERIVAEYRGRITAANHPDGGAVVSVSVPVAKEQADAVCEGAQSC